MTIFAVDNFTGALNRNHPEKINPNECSVLKNMITVDGAATSIEGRNLYNQVEIITNTPVKSLYRFYKTGHTVNDDAATTKQGWTVARCGQFVWIACEETDTVTAIDATAPGKSITISAAKAKLFPSYGTLMVTPTTGDTTPYQLAYTAKNETTGVLTVADGTTIPANANGATVQVVDFRPIWYTANNTDSVDFESFNGRLYMTCDGMQRFDGFYYAVSTCTTTSGNATVQFAAGVDLTNVRAGDKFFARKADGTWNTRYTISTKDVANRTITFGSNYNESLTDTDYIIVRTNAAGIAPPMGAPSVTAAAAGSSALDTGAVYKYAYTYVYPVGGVLRESSELSPAFTTETTDAGDYFNIGVPVSWTPYSTLSIARDFYIRIYRTEGGGSTYKKLVDVTPVVPGGMWTPSSDIVYNHIDIVADASLGATYPATTTDASVKIPNLEPTVTELASGSLLTTGVHGYKFTLYNSMTGTESNPSPAKIKTITTGQQATVVATVASEDRQADYVRIYRTTAGESQYYRLIELPRVEGATTVTYVDLVADATIVANGFTLSEDHNPSPPGVYFVQSFNSTLYAWGRTDHPDWLHFSTVNDGEHWPLYEWGTGNDPTDKTLGGFVRLGQPGEKILDAVVDGGSYAETGGIGASLLVFSKTGKYRWWGSDWNDYRRDVVGSGGVAGRHCTVNISGRLFWLDRENGLVTSTGEPIYSRMFPSTRYRWSEQITRGTSDYFEKCSLINWGDYILISWPQSTSTTPNRVAMYHIPTGAWTEIGTATYPCNAMWFSVWNGPGDNNELYYGDAVTGQVWRLFAKTGIKTFWTPSTSTGVQCELQTGAILNTTNGRIYDKQCVKRLRMMFNRPDQGVNRTVTASLYANADTTATWTQSNTLAYAEGTGADVGDRSVIDVSPYLDCRSVIVGISGTFPEQVTLQGYEMQSTYRGAGRR
jgi:hypothetical protein